MEVSKNQRIAYWRTVIEICDRHMPSLESYCRAYLPRKINAMAREQDDKKRVIIEPEMFLATVPAESRVPKCETKLLGYWKTMKRRAENELTKLMLTEEEPIEECDPKELTTPFTSYLE